MSLLFVLAHVAVGGPGANTKLEAEVDVVTTVAGIAIQLALSAVSVLATRPTGLEAVIVDGAGWYF